MHIQRLKQTGHTFQLKALKLTQEVHEETFQRSEQGLVRVWKVDPVQSSGRWQFSGDEVHEQEFPGHLPVHSKGFQY